MTNYIFMIVFALLSNGSVSKHMEQYPDEASCNAMLPKMLNPLYYEEHIIDLRGKCIIVPLDPAKNSKGS